MLVLTGSVQGAAKDRTTHFHATLWRIVRLDGVVIRVTDHPHRLNFNSEDYEPTDGFSGSARRRVNELEAQNKALSGFSSSLITFADVAAQLYQRARITEYLVDWRVPWIGALDQVTYFVQETSHDADVIEFSVGDVAAELETTAGDVASPDCQVEVFSQGNGKCNVDPVTWRGVGAIVVDVITDRLLFEWDLGIFPPDNGIGVPGFYADGRVIWQTGLNFGAESDIRTNTGSAVTGVDTFQMQIPVGAEIQVGDVFDFLPGCNKQFGSRDLRGHCINRYDNHLNHQGYPHIPGSDRMTQGAKNLP